MDIQPEDVYRRLHAGEMPKTSLPAGADIHDVFARIIDEGYDGVIAIMLSSGLSGTFNTVRLMAEDFSDRLTAKVFDSCSGSLGQGMTLLQLAEDIENGMGWDELVERRAPALLAGSTVFFSVDTLEYLKRGGRIGKSNLSSCAISSRLPSPPASVRPRRTSSSPSPRSASRSLNWRASWASR